MSKGSKICFLGAFLLLVVVAVIHFMLGVWLNISSVLLIAAGALVLLAVILDWKLYWEFLTMRTTKHGMNMGVMILLVLTSLVCVNYLADKHNKTWDLTAEKLNSLSDQSMKIVKGLKDDVTIKVFYKGQAAIKKIDKIKPVLALYSDASSHIKVQYLNSYVENAQAIQYLSGLPDKDSSAVFVFVDYKGKRIRADQAFGAEARRDDFGESDMTSALIKATRTANSKIYFVTGHGEKDITSDQDQGLKEFADALKESSYKVDTLSLIDKKQVPDDANVVAIVGPSLPYLDSEMKWLRDYASNGGRLFIALDPGQRQNLANLTKTLGVEFENNYVVTLNPMVGGGLATVLGRTFDPKSEITRSFPSGERFALFPLVSEVNPAPEISSDMHADALVKSDQNSFTMNELTKQLHAKPATKAVSLAVESQGKLPDAKKDFDAVVFGDSDFLSNRALMVGINRDLALNAISKLANQTDLISIRPKLPKGTMMTLTYYDGLAVVVGGIAVPVLLLILSGVMWFRRRGA